VDFYEFDIAFLDPNILPGDIPVTYPTVFDLDYANGLTDRPNASMQVYRLYDINGTPEDRTDDIYRLIYTARDGNIAEDRPATPGAIGLARHAYEAASAAAIPSWAWWIWRSYPAAWRAVQALSSRHVPGGRFARYLDAG
jgi:hypothetical protein